MDIFVDENIPSITIEGLRKAGHDIKDSLKKPNQQKIHERIIGTMNQIKKDEWPGLIVVMRDSVRSIWKSTKS